MRNVLVTGGTRGLGLGIARTLAGSGFLMVALARKDTDALAAARDESARDGRGALHFQAYDLEDIDGIGALVKSLRAGFGPFYGLVNNAGIGTSGILANMPDSAIERLIRLNVTSPLTLTLTLTLTKYLVRSMMTGQGGRIVNVSSIVGATEVRPLGITVNAVAPGFVEADLTHEMNPGHRDKIARRSALHRMPEVADVANAVDFLFSEKAQNITGIDMTIDAGNTA